MKVAIYARKSKPPSDWRPAQEGELPPTSVEVQVRRLKAACEAQGHEVVLVETDTASGSNPNRPGWKRLLAAVRGGSVQGVWMTRTDRAMRSAKHYLEVVEVFLARGCWLDFLDQSMSSVHGKSDPMATAFRTVAAAFAQLELDLTRERSGEVMERGEDGRLYGPRSEKPAGRPVEFGPEHKFRVRGGSRVHDKARCRACRGEKGGSASSGSDPPAAEGVANPGGLTTPNEGGESRETPQPQPMEPMQGGAA